MEHPTAEDISRGVCRLLIDRGCMPLSEFSLANNRRADVAAVDRQGRFVLVEIKSSRADFLADHKWGDYLEFCDEFYFAVAPGFPLELLPESEGLIIADAYHGDVIRPSNERKLAGARRRALTLRFARTAASRLQQLRDPPIQER